MVKLASDALEAMRGSPALLALLLMQLITMVMLVYVARTNADDRQERELLMLENCLQKDGP